ncbi:MAG: methylated-DNA--[protein]-cysteine S-methyltransferase [Candidatus Paracaedibacteraceae bacterium]|nr:methylated-DNA--[protein]-cysteine S-methyltransferase [Candidatus Paracaedibacteraceae bacterium]
MIFAKELNFDWTNDNTEQHKKISSLFVYDTPFGFWISEIDSAEYMLSLKPYKPHPHDTNYYPHLPFHELPLKAKPLGTPFQLSVWKALTLIPHCTTTHYSKIASTIHNPLAVRAVGTAIGRNPIIGFIPCHRVLAKNGTLGGFAYGPELKEQLLAYEKSYAS